MPFLVPTEVPRLQISNGFADMAMAKSFVRELSATTVMGLSVLAEAVLQTVCVPKSFVVEF